MFEREKLIRFHHCDPAGIVFFPQYFVLFNELVEDWFYHGLRIDFPAFHTVEKRGFPMRKIECEFLAPSRLGEKLTLRLKVKKIGNTSLVLAVTGDVAGAERVQATLLMVLVSLTTQRPIPISPELRASLERFYLPSS